jgi:hypothetical protein
MSTQNKKATRKTSKKMESFFCVILIKASQDQYGEG